MIGSVYVNLSQKNNVHFTDVRFSSCIIVRIIIIDCEVRERYTVRDKTHEMSIIN